MTNLPLVPLPELALAIHGPDIPIMHRAWRDALDLPAEVARDAFAAASDAIRELEGTEHVGLIGDVTLYFVEPADDAAAPIGLSMMGFTTEVPGAIYIVHPYGTKNVRAVVRHEVAHLFYDAIHEVSDTTRGKHAGPGEEFARAFGGDLPDLAPIEWGAKLRRRYDVERHPADTKDTLSTVIIDGSSNMFKIAATGTVSNTIAAAGAAIAGGWTDVTITGPFSVTPAHLSFVATSAGAASPRTIGRLISWTGLTGPLRLVGLTVMDVTTLLSGTDAVVRFGGFNAQGSAQTWEARYYVLKEAAL